MPENVETKRPEITAWLKPSCGWSNGVRAVLRKYDLSYEDRDIINAPENYMEMVRVTGQAYQPSLKVGEAVLPDVSGEELEAWLIDNGIVKAVEEDADSPIDRGCEDHSAPAEFVMRR